MATLISFAVGSLFGALLAWPRSPPFLGWLAAPFLAMSAVPYYLLGLMLVFVLGFTLRLFPLGGGFTLGSIPGADPGVRARRAAPLGRARPVHRAGVGRLLALSMRGMMVTVLGEEFVAYAQARGLRGAARVPALRPAQRPASQTTTSLGLAIGYVVSGAVLVEAVFAYPGVGTVLLRAIQTFDYFVIYGVVFMVILSIGLATLILDLAYPLLDPRITYRER